jgi:hypothetical protein
MQKVMNSVTQSITLVGPHLLPPAAVLFSVLGLLDKGLAWEQVAALTFVLVIFSGLLSEALGKMIELKKTFRSVVIGVLALGLIVLEILLVHEGMAWAFNGLIEGSMLWAASIFFTILNVFAKYGFIDREYNKVPASIQHLRDTNEMFNKV